MKPRLDLSKTSRFSIWESGGWDSNSKRSIGGSAIIVGGPNGEKLPICFDVNPKQYTTQCAFFADIGQVLAAAYLNQDDNKKINVSLELARIDQLTTDLVQGEAKPFAKLQTLWVHREMASPNTLDTIYQSYDPSKESHRLEYQNLIKLAIKKAFTPLDEQYWFWGIPRTNQNSNL